MYVVISTNGYCNSSLLPLQLNNFCVNIMVITNTCACSTDFVRLSIVKIDSTFVCMMHIIISDLIDSVYQV